MKKSLLTLGLIAFLSLTAASCSTDDSELNESAGFGLTNPTPIPPTPPTPIDNGDRDLPKPPLKP